MKTTAKRKPTEDEARKLFRNGVAEEARHGVSPSWVHSGQTLAWAFRDHEGELIELFGRAEAERRVVAR